MGRNTDCGLVFSSLACANTDVCPTVWSAKARGGMFDWNKGELGQAVPFTSLRNLQTRHYLSRDPAKTCPDRRNPSPLRWKLQGPEAHPCQRMYLWVIVTILEQEVRDLLALCVTSWSGCFCNLSLLDSLSTGSLKLKMLVLRAANTRSTFKDKCCQILQQQDVFDALTN